MAASLDDRELDTLTNRTVDLLQTMIRNECVNDGTRESGHETRNADVLEQVIAGPSVDIERFEPVPGRASVVGRIAGTDPDAPSLCLMGHTDVVPVHADGWTNDPFGGELIDGEVWGRGAVDMLNLTSSMAVAFRDIADDVARGAFRPTGDLIYFGVADEESGSTHGARWMADNHPDAIRADYVLTENGGIHSGPAEDPFVGVNVAEKGVAWRRLTVRGTPGHGSMPFRKDNALVKAAGVVQRLADYRPAPQFTELWRTRVETLGLPEDWAAALLDESAIDGFLDELPSIPAAAHLHACTHMTFSPNLVDGGHMKTNVIPDQVVVEVDIRTLPGDGAEEVDAHLRAALGDLADHVEVEIMMNDPASTSRLDTPLWDALARAVNIPFPTARLTPQLAVGFTDARIYREMGAVAYGAGLFSPDLNASEFGSRFHGHNERIDVESLSLTTRLWHHVCRDFLG
ncbi:MAG: acetylornithine deacetylase/succinyl-diaminopimelate desuccinylase-like protein [Ilumatobacter sp.]|jgi:acetylornithine deacetylase/succinyl-diaminopimelate desuccinylase-like protein